MESPGGRAEWIKATKSMAGDACVELMQGGEHAYVRDSKKPDTTVRLPTAIVAELVQRAKEGELDWLIEP